MCIVKHVFKKMVGKEEAGIDHVAMRRHAFRRRRSPPPQKAEFIATSSFQKVDDLADTSNHGEKIQNLPALHDLQGHSYPESPIRHESSQSVRS
jgi:hypothetical protein